MPTPRKTDGMHKLTGTKSQATAPPPQEFAPGRPKCPKGVSGDAKKAFNRLRKLLETRRALTAEDGELMRLYAITFDRHERALAKIQEQGDVVEYTRLNNHGEEVKTEKHNLYLKIAETCEKNLVAILDRLGLTPLNRAKVKPTAEPEPKKEFKEGTVGWYKEQKRLGLIGGNDEQQNNADNRGSRVGDESSNLLDADL